jgi:hypothetical protein
VKARVQIPQMLHDAVLGLMVEEELTTVDNRGAEHQSKVLKASGAIAK